MDYFSRWVELFPLRSATGAEVARVLEQEIFLRYGASLYVLTDNGPAFVSGEFDQMAKRIGVKHIRTSAYHPASNFVERVHQTVKNMLKAFIDNGRGNEWVPMLPYVRFVINSAVNATTGVTPAHLMLGRPILSVFERVIQPRCELPAAEAIDRIHIERMNDLVKLYEVANVRQAKVLDRYKKVYDRNRVAHAYTPGMKVLYRDHPIACKEKGICPGLMMRWKGPLLIERVFKNDVLLLRDGVRLTTRHVDEVKKYIERSGATGEKAVFPAEEKFVHPYSLRPRLVKKEKG
jgi:hypothetical protein